MVGLEGYKQLGSPTLAPTNTHLKAYGEKKLQVKGQCVVNVTVGDGEKTNLKLLVVDSPQGTNLLGLDWSDEFGLSKYGTTAFHDAVEENTRAVSDSSNQIAGMSLRLPHLTNKYAEVFKTGLGHCTKVKAPIHLKDNANIKFFKPREIPF
jgi:hypothetical protein